MYTQSPVFNFSLHWYYIVHNVLQNIYTPILLISKSQKTRNKIFKKLIIFLYAVSIRTVCILFCQRSCWLKTLKLYNQLKFVFFLVIIFCCYLLITHKPNKSILNCNCNCNCKLSLNRYCQFQVIFIYIGEVFLCSILIYSTLSELSLI